jgi:hypothetical protein
MTPAEAQRRCLAAKLDVLDVARVGRQICVTVPRLPCEVETVVKRLGTSFTLSYGDGTGTVALYFTADE